MRYMLIIFLSFFVVSISSAQTISKTTTTKTVTTGTNDQIVTKEVIIHEHEVSDTSDDLYQRRQERANQNIVNPDVAIAAGAAGAIGAVIYNGNRYNRRYRRHHHR